MWTLPLGIISNADPDSGVEANMYFDVDFNAYATNSKVSDSDLNLTKTTKTFSVVCKFSSHYWLLWWVTSPDARPVNQPITQHYSPKPQQSVKQWMPFANDGEANHHTSQ